MDTLDLDLHGKTWPEALQEFVDAYNKAVQPGGHTCRLLRVVHGYGSTGSGGVLRTRFRRFFESHQDRLEFTPGERSRRQPRLYRGDAKATIAGRRCGPVRTGEGLLRTAKDAEQDRGPVPALRKPKGSTSREVAGDTEAAPQSAQRQGQRVPGRLTGPQYDRWDQPTDIIVSKRGMPGGKPWEKCCNRGRGSPSWN